MGIILAVEAQCAASTNKTYNSRYLSTVQRLWVPLNKWSRRKGWALEWEATVNNHWQFQHTIREEKETRHSRRATTIHWLLDPNVVQKSPSATLSLRPTSISCWRWCSLCTNDASDTETMLGPWLFSIVGHTLLAHDISLHAFIAFMDG